MPLIFYRLLAMYLGVVVDFGTLFHTNQELCVAQFEMGLKGSHLCASWAGLIGPTIRGRSSKWTAYNSSQSIKGWIRTLTLIRFLSYLPYLLSGSQRKGRWWCLPRVPCPRLSREGQRHSRAHVGDSAAVAGYCQIASPTCRWALPMRQQHNT